MSEQEKKQELSYIKFSPKNTNEFVSQNGVEMVGFKIPMPNGEPWLESAIAKKMVHTEKDSDMNFIYLPSDQEMKMHQSVKQEDGTFATVEKVMTAKEVAEIGKEHTKAKGSAYVTLSFGKANSTGNGKEFTSKSGTPMVAFKVPRKDAPWLETAFAEKLTKTDQYGNLSVSVKADEEMKLSYSEKQEDGTFAKNEVKMSAKEVSGLLEANRQQYKESKETIAKKGPTEEAR